MVCLQILFISVKEKARSESLQKVMEQQMKIFQVKFDQEDDQLKECKNSLNKFRSLHSKPWATGQCQSEIWGVHAISTFSERVVPQCYELSIFETVTVEVRN